MLQKFLPSNEVNTNNHDELEEIKKAIESYERKGDQSEKSEIIFQKYQKEVAMSGVLFNSRFKSWISILCYKL